MRALRVCASLHPLARSRVRCPAAQAAFINHSSNCRVNNMGARGCTRLSSSAIASWGMRHDMAAAPLPWRRQCIVEWSLISLLFQNLLITAANMLLDLLQELASCFRSPAATAEEAFSARPLVEQLRQAVNAFVPDEDELPRLHQ